MPASSSFATEQYFPVMLYEVVLTVGSEYEILKCDHSKWKLLSSTFIWCLESCAVLSVPIFEFVDETLNLCLLSLSTIFAPISTMKKIQVIFSLILLFSPLIEILVFKFSVRSLAGEFESVSRRGIWRHESGRQRQATEMGGEKGGKKLESGAG